MKSDNYTHRHVALLIETSNEYARGILRGIRAYVREHQTWSVYLWEHDRNTTDLSRLENWHGDGILVRIENKNVADFISKSTLPAVDLSAANLIPDLPCVETDDFSIAILAYEHLRDKGYSHFAYCGDSNFNWSINREHYFMDAVEKSNKTCSVFDSKQFRFDFSMSECSAMIAWAKLLPKPCGIMAGYDIQGQKLLEACALAAIKLPDEIGIIGCDNDALLCELSSPSLTSIQPNTIRTGYEAARILDRLMDGQPVESRLTLIQPTDIIARQSTDILYIDDSILSDAIRFIRENAHYNINVDDILKAIPVSRRILESRFRKKLGRSPHDEIIDVRIRHARQLLEKTDLTISEISERVGFLNSDYFSVAFKKKVGKSPSIYRRDEVNRYN